MIVLFTVLLQNHCYFLIITTKCFFLKDQSERKLRNTILSVLESLIRFDSSELLSVQAEPTAGKCTEIELIDTF